MQRKTQVRANYGRKIEARNRGRRREQERRRKAKVIIEDRRKRDRRRKQVREGNGSARSTSIPEMR